MFNITVSKVAGVWSVLVDGFVQEAGFADRVAAVSAANSLRTTMKYEQMAIDMTIDHIVKSFVRSH